MNGDPLNTWKDDPNYRLLQAEVEALGKRVENKSELGRAMRDLWDEHHIADDAGEEGHIDFYRRVLAHMMQGRFERIVTPTPVSDLDTFGVNLVQLNSVLDQKFAEVRALSEIASEINEGIFIEDVLDHVFDTFRPMIPYDRVGFALLDVDADGVSIVKAYWVRSDFKVIHIQKGFSQPLKASSLNEVSQSGEPRIINDLEAYAHEHPDSVSSRLLVEEGVRSSLTCPLIVKGDVMGFMFFSSRQPGRYDISHAHTFMEIAGQLALTLEKSRLYEKLTIRNKFIRSVFGRYMSNDIANSLLQNPEALKMGGRKCKVTVLLSDIRGFTAMSEHMEPELVVSSLNTCFNVMVDVIHKHHGTIDNIIGDALMVLFGAPVANEDDAPRAIACALHMQTAMADVNAQIVQLGLPKLSIGIGISTGDVVAGNIGSEAHAKYSVIGAPVNLAARLEAKAGRGEILISQPTFDDVHEHVKVLDQREIEAKGFSDPVQAYSVTGV